MVIISKDQYKIHIFFEILAIVIVIPMLIIFLYNNWKNINIIYKAFFITLILITLLVDGYLLYKWLIIFNVNKKNKINKSINKAQILIRQSARYAHAARQDKDILIALLHANYGSGYLFAAKDIYPENELIDLFPSYNKYKEFTREIINIQDEVNRRAVTECPKLITNKDIITVMSGTSN